jgi:polar amino acid transport system ATP-binding protein
MVYPRGMTMIVDTYEIGFARKIAKTVILMEKGPIVETGSAYDIFYRPSQDKTRQFLSDVM